MKPVQVAVVCQVMLLVYHQLTTFLDLYPFNGARFYSRREKLLEMGVNLALMGLAIVGTAFGISGLRLYGVVYYFLLLAVEVVIWWVPYFVRPQGVSRRVYNWVLAIGTSDFETGDALARWQAVFERIHSRTLTILPKRPGRMTPTLSTPSSTWRHWPLLSPHCMHTSNAHDSIGRTRPNRSIER